MASREGQGPGQQWRANFEIASKKYGLPPGLLERVARVESNFNPRAVSPAGAVGLMQIMPNYHPDVDPWDPEASIDYAAKYLRQNYDQFGRWDLALAAYNAGPGNVRKHGGIPPFRETQNYVENIINNVDGLGGIQDDPELRPRSETDSPFGFLRPLMGAQTARPIPPKDPNSPFAFLQNLDPGRPPEQPIDPALGRFIRGTGRGVVHPVRAFFNTEDREDLGVAGMAGEFLGAGLTFVPLFKGASLALRGVGLTKSGIALGARTTFLAPIGMTPTGVRGAYIAKGSLAFAGFEAFAGESVEEAPMRALRGIAEGAVFEAGLMKVASAWRRSRRAKWEPSGTPTYSVPKSVDADVSIHPLALKLENMMRPAIGDAPETVMAKLRAMGEPKQQLHEMLAGFVGNHMKGGQAILSGLTQRELKQLSVAAAEFGTFKFRSAFARKHFGKQFGQLVKRNIELIPHRRVKGEDLFDVWVFNTNKDLWNVKSGTSLTPSNLLALIRKRFDDLEVAFPDEIPTKKKNWKISGQYHPGTLTYTPPHTLGIDIATAGEALKTLHGVSTMVHELMHHITTRANIQHLRRQGMVEANIVTSPVASMDLSVLLNYARRDARGRFSVMAPGLKEDDIRRELQAATESLLTRWFMERGHNNTKALAQAKLSIAAEKNYYHSPNELASRMLELIFVDPQAANRVAPNASKLFGNLLYRDAPDIHNALTKSGQTTVDLFRDHWRRFGEDAPRSLFTHQTRMPTLEQKLAFGQTGWAPGMRVLKDGTEFEFLSAVKANRGDPFPTRALVKDLTTGAEDVVDMKQLQRPFAGKLVLNDEKILRALDKVLDETPTEIPLNLLGYNGLVRRLTLDTTDYVTVNTSIGEWIRTLPNAIQEQIIQRHGQIVPLNLRDLAKMQDGDISAELAYLRDIMALTGRKGIVQNDNGILAVLPLDAATVGKSLHVTESPRFGAHIAGDSTKSIFTPSTEDLIRHQLRKAGVSEVDLDFFYEAAERRFGDRLRQLRADDVVQTEANVAAATKAANKKAVKEGQLELPLAVDDGNMAPLSRANIVADRMPDGRIELRDADSKTVLARVRNTDEALDYAAEVTSDGVGPALAKMPGAPTYGGGGPPPKPNAPLIPSTPPPPPAGASPASHRRWYSNIESTLFGRHLTALENTAKKFESLGLGSAYTKIYLPAHNAMLQVQRELTQIGRDAFGGLTFKDKIKQLSDSLIGVSPKRHPTITGHIEAITREEMEKAGGLMVRAMSDNEIRIAQFIDGVGLGQDVPRLMAVNRLVEGTLKGNVENVIKRMRGIELSPEAQQLAQVFESMPKFKTAEEIFDFLALTAEERQVIKIITDSMKADKDKFSIMAVSRWASAPHLKKGFRDGKEQFAFENKMTAKELTASKLASEILEAGFSESGIEAKRHVTGYFPHLRKWVQEGITPDSSILPDDVLAWVATRYRTGEMNVYEQNPILGVYRHLRGLYMNRHFDTIMPDVNDAIRQMEQVDSRAAKVMQEYVMELIGKPHESFQNMQHALSTTMKAVLGKEPPQGFVNDVINTLAALASSAMLPFRPALIVRNFYESFLKVAPRTGVNEYFQGLRYVVDGKTRKAAFREALDAGAIRPGSTKLRSLHGAEELFGPNAPGLVDKYLRIFDKGFEWYQSADDWGRAVAFHAQKIRVQKHMDDYMKKRISLEEFKSRAKINTFDPLDIRIAEEAILNGQHDKAINHLGQVLSRETMTRYGYADHPVGWHSVPGRLFGQFGTWPVQYKDYLIQGVTRGSAKDRIEFASIHGAITGATILGGASVGVNLQNWTGMQFYAGGPYADLMVDVVRSVTGSEAEKALARMSLYGQIPVLGWMETGNPRSMFVPGSFLLGDLDSARQFFATGDALEGFLSGTGLRIMRPSEPRPLEDLYRHF